MKNNLLKIVALILLTVLAASCYRHDMRRYKTKWRHHRHHMHYRGAWRYY